MESLQFESINRSPNRRPKPKTAFRRESTNERDKLIADCYKDTLSNVQPKSKKGSKMMVTDHSVDKITLNLK